MADSSLNGGRTQPLTDYARRELEKLKAGPRPRQSFNPGVADRLTRGAEPLAEEVSLPSPYKSAKGSKARHLRITQAGVAELAEKP